SGAGSHGVPDEHAVAAAGSDELARRKGLATASEARALGVAWVLAPVLDVNTNPRNPIINTRSFGSRAEDVTRLARAYVGGLHEGGALACGKHFPGHGEVAVDSHLEVAYLDQTISGLRATELVPYRHLLRQADS